MQKLPQCAIFKIKHIEIPTISKGNQLLLYYKKDVNPTIKSVL